MPSRPCKHPTCDQYIHAPACYCDAHQPDAAAQNAERHRQYDLFSRDRESKRFYNSKAWLIARQNALVANPWCSRCLTSFADMVHHAIPVKEATAAQKVDQRHLIPLCWSCHAKIEAEIRTETECDAETSRG